MNASLKESVREYVESSALTDDQLQKLESLFGPVKFENTAPENVQRKSTYPLAIVGAVAVFLLVLLLTTFITEQGDVRERIAKEVATNHIKSKPLEIKTTNMEDIRSYFKKLDFLPVNSRLISDAGFELIGGRYCSLQGVVAAQLKIKKPNSNVVQTLYQTEYRKDIFENMPSLEEGGEPVDIYMKGIKVRIWVEKGLLFALTDLPEN